MHVPHELSSRARWVCWKSEARNGKQTKVPYQPNGRRAKSNDPATWSTLAACTAAKGFAGIGFVLGDGVVGVDVDIPWKDQLPQRVIEHFSGTYCERSPNGKLHVFALGNITQSGKGDKDFEAYDERSPRYLTFTGDHIEGTAREVTAQADAIAWLERTHFAKKVDPAAAIVKRIEADPKWSKLFNGAWEGDYKSHSEADLALCIDIARLSRDKKLIDKVFRLSALWRPQWDDKRGQLTYGQLTINTAWSRTAEAAAATTAAWGGGLEAGERVTVNGVPKVVTTIEDLNERFALLLAPGNPEAIIRCVDGSVCSTKDLTLRLSNEVVFIGTDKKGGPIFEEADKYWIGSADRAVYRSVAFTNKPVAADVFNLFPGFALKPREGDCGLILAHIRDVLCSGDPEAYEAMLNLIAWQFQHIGRPSRVIVCLRSDEHQTGKGTFLEEVMLRIYNGDAGVGAGLKIEQLESITGDFNGALRGRAFIFADEATYLGDRKGAAVLKSLVGTRVINLNEKFLPRLSIPVAINIWMTTNAITPTPIDEKDGRYWFLDVSAARKNDRAYWDPLYYQARGDGSAAFLHMMLARDVSKFHPQDNVPRKNAALARAIRESRQPGNVRDWLETCLETGTLVGVLSGRRDMPWPEEGEKVFASVLWTAYTCWVKSLVGTGTRTESMATFYNTLHDAGFGDSIHTKNGNVRAAPSIERMAEYLRL